MNLTEWFKLFVEMLGFFMAIVFLLFLYIVFI